MAEKPVKIPFDNLSLLAVVEQLQGFIDGKIQGIRQPSETDVAIGLYARGGEAMLLVSCDPVFARAHLITKRPSNQPQPPTFLATLRARLEGGRLLSVRQIGFDRILELQVGTPEGEHRVIAELMGKHSNIMLVDESLRVVAAAKWVNADKSSRPILSGHPYELPPVISAEDASISVASIAALDGALGKGDPTITARISPFLKKLLLSGGSLPDKFHPVLSPGHGAYPISVAALGLSEVPKTDFSLALEQHFNSAIPAYEAELLRHGLLAALRRVLLAREVSLEDLKQAESQGLKAGLLQREAELILTYGPSVAAGSSTLQAWDYEGNELTIKLNPELSYKDNAQKVFDKARKAKSRLGMVHDQIERISKDREALLSLIAEVESEPRLDRLRELQEQAKSRRWTSSQRLVTATKEDRPYEGHRVRELIGPGGITVLYGENAESNDFLTLRVAKPNDYWLHVRGHTSAHVVIQTQNHPEKIQTEHLLFAAKVAVNNSRTKHSGYVPVDYTLRKYVRRPKGAPKGTALYTHEKTVHVDGDR